MGLFPKDTESDASSSAPSRMKWTREVGTRQLLTVLGIIAVVWFGGGQVYDRYLLQTQWKPLQPSPGGMTLVGTLNSRDSYDRNLLKIFNTNKSSRVVITEFGWKSIFDERNGPLFSDAVANAIKSAMQQDDVVGYAMLTPYLRATINWQLGDTTAYKFIREELPIFIPMHTKDGKDEQTTLGVLLRRYSGVSAERADGPDTSGEGSASGREKENVTTVTPETLIVACPVILTEGQISSASLEEVPGNALTPTTYTIHLELSPEGRSRFFQWSHGHLNENVVFVLNGQVVAAPRITQPLNVNDFAINNVQDLKGAQSLVEFFKSRSK